MKKRIVVTGMGLVSCFGSDIDKFYQNLLLGKSGVGLIEKFDCSEYPTRFASEIKNFEVGEYMEKKQARRVDPFISYAMVAGKKSLEDAFLKKEEINPERAGIIIGSGMGGMGVFSSGVLTLKEKGYKRITPFFVPYIITNMAGALLAIDVGFQGPNFSVSTACATGNYSILKAAEQIVLGNADIMICGGTEAPMTPIGLAGFVASRVLSTRNEDPQKASRPWDKGRDGFVMGEGCGVIVLEEREHALKRGARIYAEFLGGSINTDAYHMTDPREDGSVVATCMADAIKKAGIKETDINYINAHATSTFAGDLCEVRAIKKVFSKPEDIYINATKSLIGHCLGAAGGIESIVVVKAIEKGVLHPTLNVEDPEEEVRGMRIVKEKKEVKIKAAMNNSFGFGGHNSSLIFGPYKD